MSAHLVTFATEDMSRAQDLCVVSAMSKGGIGSNQIHRFTPWEIKGHAGGQTEVHELYQNNRKVFDAPRGAGFWAWKPTLIYYYALAKHAFLYGVSEGDVIVYSDAGIEFLNNVSHIIDRMGHDKPQDDVWLFGNNWEHAHWCKRDVVEAIFPMKRLGELAGGALFAGKPWSDFGKQVQASVIFFRVSDYSRKFVKEWLDWCLFEGGRLIDDSPSRLPNHPEFQEHRHDQAILTTMAYREGISVHWWPAVYNRGGSPEFVYEKLPEYAGDDYPCLFSHHRKRDHEWEG